MTSLVIDQQFHGYRNGHQLLSSTCKLGRSDQDVLTYMSDLSGPLEPGQKFKPYLSGYPLPSGKFYVLAKTWQDRDVDRSGCVFTRSFLINSEILGGLRNLAQLADELGALDKPLVEIECHKFSAKERHLSTVKNPNIREVAKAIYFQGGTPTVCFGWDQEDEVCLRVLQAGPVTFSKRFSFCTMSLAPRSIDGTPLSLQFSPVTSKSRFSRWPGNRVGNSPSTEMSESNLELSDLVEAVFLAKQPDIRSIDKSGLFWKSETQNDVPVRIVLLWSRMSREAKTSLPTLLGLLDLSSTLGTIANLALKQLKPVLRYWLSELPRNQSTLVYAEFLAALFSKIRNTDIQIWEDVPFRQAVLSLAASDPRRTVELLLPSLDRGNWISDLLMPSIGDGLARVEPSELDRLIEGSLSNDQVFELMAASRPAALAMAETEVLNGVSIASSFETAVEGDQVLDASKWSGNMLSALWSSEQKHLLRSIMTILGGKVDLNPILQIFQNNNFVASEFDKILLSNEAVQRNLSKLLKSLLDDVSREDADRFVAASIAAQPEALGVLLPLLNSNVDRLRKIVRLFVSEQENETIAAVIEYGSNEKLFIDLAAGLTTKAPDLSLELLTFVASPSEAALQIALECWLGVEEEHIVLAAEQSLRFALPLESRSADAAVLRALEVAGLNVQPLTFVHSGFSAQLVERNLLSWAKYVEKSGDPTGKGISQITSSLIDYGVEKIAPKVWENLGGIFEYAQSKRIDEYEHCAARLWRRAVQLNRLDLSSLAVLAFPIVHGALKRTVQPPPYYSLRYYSDWDKCKSARAELVRIYLFSAWPLEGLLKIAIKIQEIHSVIELVRLQYGGQEHVRKLIAAIENLPPRDRQILDTLLEH